MINRRKFLVNSAVTALAMTTTRLSLAEEPKTPAATPPPASGPFKLPPLPYAYDALEPHIDAQTMQIHHDRHHAAYVSKLNEAVAGKPDLEGKSIEELLRHLDKVPEAVRTAVRNHGGGHANHTLFWRTMAPAKGEAKPKGELAKAIDKGFGSFDAFTQKLTQSAVGIFGSGWAWLTVGEGGALTLETTPNQDTPLSAGRQPLLGIDVWEHAYYLKYQNKRADYVAAWLKVVSWDAVAADYGKAT